MPEIYLIFKKKPDTRLENFVQWIAGDMVHVDIAPGKHGVMFTCFMFEKFSINKCDGYSPLTHECLSLDVDESELKNIQSALIKLVEKQIPYNYSDVLQLMFHTDVQNSDHESLDSADALFCSQAVTLVLKFNLTENKQLIQSLNLLNSRTTTSNILYNAIKPFCKEANDYLKK
jgi:hypothetical protein